MKKIFLLLMWAGLTPIVYADAITPPVPVKFPTTAQTSFLNDQIIITLINHGSFVEEYRRGQKQIILSDNVIEAGHLAGQYVVAFDVSAYQDPSKTGLDAEAGLRLNLHALINRYVTFTPQWQAVLSNLEYYPRVGFDFGQDHAHAWIATFNLGFGFGPGAGIPQ